MPEYFAIMLKSFEELLCSNLYLHNVSMASADGVNPYCTHSGGGSAPRMHQLLHEQSSAPHMYHSHACTL